MTEAYPLQWPQGKPRTKYPERSRFNVGAAMARDELFRELEMLGGKNIVVSTNVKLRMDGMPYASQRDPDDRGVSVYFTYKDNQVCFSCDRWDLVKDNMQAIRHTIAALRGISRWGTGDMVEAAFRGFAALPPPSIHWSLILNIGTTLPIEDIEAQYKSLARKHHPDNGGDTETMAEINKAIRQAREEKRAA